MDKYAIRLTYVLYIVLREKDNRARVLELRSEDTSEITWRLLNRRIVCDQDDAMDRCNPEDSLARRRDLVESTEKNERSREGGTKNPTEARCASRPRFGKELPGFGWTRTRYNYAISTYYRRFSPNFLVFTDGFVSAGSVLLSPEPTPA